MKIGLIAAAAVLASSVTAAHADGDAAAGEKVFKKCIACHAVGPEAKNKVGPVLNGVVGAVIGHNPDFKYSKIILEKHAAGETWTEDNLEAWLKDPKKFAKGNKMAFAGLKKEDEIEDVIAYLKTFP